MATKKAATKKTATKKTATKKTPARKSSAKKISAESSESGASDLRPAERASRRSSSAPRAAASRAKSGAEVSDSAVAEIHERTGRRVESVTSLQHGDEGWRVEVEVLEVERIPNTTDLLALYEVQLDDSGALQGFRRLSRYVRGTPDDR